LTSFGPFLRQSFGKIHFAGTETAREWTGYMNGAVEAGQRAAFEVLDSANRITESERKRERDERAKRDELSAKHRNGLTAPFIERHPPSINSIIFVAIAATVGITAAAAANYDAIIAAPTRLMEVF